jgi:hypothetical protein
MIIDRFIKEYILLALRINRIFDGYVDAYYGPSELKEMIENEPIRSATKLINETRTLQKKLAQKINDSTRERYIGTNLKAMEAFLTILSGKKIDFIEQVNAILGVTPDIFPNDREFYDLQEQFNQSYIGVGTLNERMESYKERRRIPIDEFIPKFKRALEITCFRTKELFPNLLPESESFTIQLSKEKVGWAFYNQYQGNYHSLFKINPFQPLYWTTFLSSAAHEGYPGHHTEFTVKNKLLYDQLKWSEHCIILLNTPAGVVIEGIADTALEVLFSPNEKIKIELEEFCPNPNKEDSIETLIRQDELKYKIKKFVVHLANRANIEGCSEKELFDYGMNFGFYPKENLQSDISFILDPKYRIYIYTYNYGRELIAKKFGFPPKLDDFRYLLSNPVLSSDII